MILTPVIRLIYDISFGTGPSPGTVSVGQTGTTFDPGELLPNTTYYWQIVSRDAFDTETTGPVWQFTTVAPGTLQFDSAEYSVTENDGSVDITVIRSNGSQGEVSVDLTTVDIGSATPVDDYTETTNTLTFAEGETSKTFTVMIIDDLRAENTETVGLSISNPLGGATLGAIVNATLTINDDPTDVIAGDINNDEWVDLTDLIIVLKVLNGIDQEGPIALGADIDGDGKNWH